MSDLYKNVFLDLNKNDRGLYNYKIWEEEIKGLVFKVSIIYIMGLLWVIWDFNEF